LSYFVKEIFYTLQGEGANAGRPAVFCRFTGCNLWSGRKSERSLAQCPFCDTDFVGTDGIGGGIFPDPECLAASVNSYWPNDASPAALKFVVCTGGEPLLQLDSALISALHRAGFQIGLETNGTRIPPTGIDWICVSPKARTEWALRAGHELKIVYPQKDLDPKSFEHLDFRYFFLQPMDGPHLQANVKATVDYCLANPRWRLSLQLHKIVGIR